MSSRQLLPSSEIAVGHCVILNDIEQPYGRLIAVIMEMQGNIAFCNYLNADSRLSSFNKKLGMIVNPEEWNTTPVSKFGVEVSYCPEDGSYCCNRIGESVATYQDGKPRQWQERAPITYTARRGVVKCCIDKEVNPS